jgi:hypothetical protein
MTLSTIVSSRLEPLYRRKPSHKRSAQRSNFTGEIERGFVSHRRGLINAQPDTDGCQFYEDEVAGCEFVVAGGDTPTPLDLVEEPLDKFAPFLAL